MKKLLLSIALLPTLLLAQEADSKLNKQQKGIFSTDPIVNERLSNQKVIVRSAIKPLMKAEGLISTKIGETTFDQQTNNSMPQRIVLSSGGKISAAWMYSSQMSAGRTDRGSNWNYFDGTGWVGARSSRIESARAGYNCIVTINDGGTEKNMMISHRAEGVANDVLTTGGLFIMKNDKLGSDNWTEKKLLVPNGPMWPRAATGDKYVHVIGAYQPQTNPSKNKIANGVKHPMLYYRYDIANDTFDIKDFALPGYDSTRIKEGDADVYSIDAKDSTVVIVTGGLTEDVTMWKSMDNGKTWEKKIIKYFPHAPYDSRVDNIFDSTGSNSGSVHAILDNNLKAHIFYPNAAVVNRNDDGVDSSYSIYFRTDGIYYYNEYDTSRRLRVGQMYVPDGDVYDNVWPSPGNYNGRKGNPNANYSVAARYMFGSVSTWPTATVDDSNIIYLTYSTTNVLRTTQDNQTYRDIFVTFSRDNGATWSKLIKLTNDDLSEFAYPCAARKADSHFHLMWQQDFEPGNSVTNDDDVQISDIMYGKISLEDLKAGITAVVGINDVNNSFSLGKVYPNPTTNLININFTNSKTTNATVRVVDILGNTIQTENKGLLIDGIHQFTFDASTLSSGIYYYEVNANGYKLTQKFIKE